MYGKKAEQMATEVPMAMKHSLLYEVAEGIKCARGAGEWGQARDLAIGRVCSVGCLLKF